MVQLVDSLKRLEGGARRGAGGRAGGGDSASGSGGCSAPLLALRPPRSSPPALLSPDAAAPSRAAPGAAMKVLGHKIELLTGTAGPRRPLLSAAGRERGAAAGASGGSGSGMRREGGCRPIPSPCAARARPGPARLCYPRACGACAAGARVRGATLWHFRVAELQAGPRRGKGA